MISFDFIVERSKFEVHAKGHLVEGITTLVGASGSGKSTFLKSLAGLLRPTRGFIKDKENYWYNSETNICLSPQNRWVGYMPQGNIVFPHLSVRHNILFSKRGDEILYKQLLNQLHLEQYEDVKAGMLSGGEQQRVALGRALFAKPRVLLLDEPLSALDWNLRNQVRQDIVKIIEKNKIPCLWVTHDQEEAECVGRYCWQLDHGEIIKRENKDME